MAKQSERKVKALNVVRDGEVIHTVKINPPKGEFSRHVEAVTSGLLRRVSPDDIVKEVYAVPGPPSGQTERKRGEAIERLGYPDDNEET